MPVPLLDVVAQNRPLEAEMVAAFQRLLGHGQFILGPEVAAFEAACAAWLGVPDAIGVSSGTDALLLALMAAGIGPGDEVICPTFTFFATAGSVRRLGAVPVFCDGRPDTFNLDPESAAGKVTARTKAIMPVHLFGQMAEMEPVLALAARHGLVVIEDAAQAMGAKQRGKQAGTCGDYGAYSFFPSKNLGGLGDSGLLVVRDPEAAERARVLRVHGAKPRYYHELVGANFRLDALQAALLGVKLPHLSAYEEGRRRNAEAYREQLGDLAGVGPNAPDGQAAPGSSRILLPVVAPGNHAIWNQFTIRLPRPGDRDALRSFLEARKIGCEVYYPVPLHRQKCFADLGSRDEDFPVANALAGEVLSLPVYPELPASQREEVVAAIRAFLA